MGMPEQQVKDCIGNDSARLALNKRINDSAEAAHIDSTPSFVINGKTCADCQDPAAMDKAIAAAEAAKQ
jgi:protein-disulfide isomerase